MRGTVSLVNRYFTKDGDTLVSVATGMEWVHHDVVLTDYRTGNVTFEQRGVEFPSTWGKTAVDIVASKYFYGELGSPEREGSLFTLVRRVVREYSGAGVEEGYFSDEDSVVFEAELGYLLLNQMFSFNSPVWFNVGTPHKQAVSACFILDVDDNVPSILNWFTEEGTIFKGGSGAGVNLSKIRGSREQVTGGGLASGPASFMCGADAVAGMIKSGGTHRRSAKMVFLNDDHPDIEEFVTLKVNEEEKIRALRDAGFDMSVGGKDMYSVQYQNANNSVMLSDEFMAAAAAGGTWDLINRTDGSVAKTVGAAGLLRLIATSAWSCGDPGVGFYSTINKWNSLHQVGDIVSSNPCLRGDTPVPTRTGIVRIGDWALTGETREVWDGAKWVRASASATGVKPTVELKLSTNRSLVMTADHRVSSGGVFMPASDMAGHPIDVSRPQHDKSEFLTQYVIAGMLHGDGTTHKASRGKWYLTIGEKDSCMQEYMIKHDESAEVRQYSGRVQVWTSGSYSVNKDIIPERWITEGVYSGSPRVVRSFLRGLYSANGSVAVSHKRVNLKTTHLAMAHQVMDMLASIGIRASLVTTRPATVEHSNGTYSGRESYSVAINGVYDVTLFANQIGFLHEYKEGRLREVVSLNSAGPRDVKVLDVVPTGLVEPVFDFHMEDTHSACVAGYKIHNCGEYLSISNSSCNLGSLNLMKFRSGDKDHIDESAFSAAVRLAILAMDISICFAELPTEKVERNTKRYRQLGLGYANLGALLMSHGLAYDSYEGRDAAAAITELMTLTALNASADIAGVVGTYEGFEETRDGMLEVLAKHQREAADDFAFENLYLRVRETGIRNSNVSLLAPTGTIGLMMGCSTTGIEPAFALTSYKTTVTGDTIVTTLPEAEMGAKALGLAEVDPTHPVFATAVGANSISPSGHIKMMAAVQPMLSMGISKTINVPADATVEDVENVIVEGHKLGLKAMALYRDGSKASQPMSSKAKAEPAVETYASDSVARRKLSKRRNGYTHSFSVAGTDGYLTTGEFSDGSLGEIFLKVSKAGSTLNGMLDAVAIATSIGLQYGVPLETLVEKFRGTKYSPAGITDDAEVRMASSLLDYVFRRLELDYLSPEGAVEASQETTDATPAPAHTDTTDGELCSSCGGPTMRTGSCHVCTSCGTASGCS